MSAKLMVILAEKKLEKHPCVRCAVLTAVDFHSSRGPSFKHTSLAFIQLTAGTKTPLAVTDIFIRVTVDLPIRNVETPSLYATAFN